MLNIAEQAWQLTGWRPDLPDVARIDAMREAARILCREGLCLRETIVINQPAGDAFIRPYASENPKVRDGIRVMAVALDGQMLQASDPGNVLMGQIPQQLGTGIPSSYIPLFDGTAMLNVKPDKVTRLYVLTASCPVGPFLDVDLPESMIDAIIAGARYVLMSRPGKGQDMRSAAEYRYQFGAYIQGLRATASMGLTPQDYRNLIQAPLRGVGGGPGPVDPPPIGEPCTLVTDGTPGFVGVINFNYFAFNTFGWSLEFTQYPSVPSSIKVVTTVKRGGSEITHEEIISSLTVDGTNKLVHPTPSAGPTEIPMAGGTTGAPGVPFGYTDEVSVAAYVDTGTGYLSTPSLRRCVTLEEPFPLDVKFVRATGSFETGFSSYVVSVAATRGSRTVDFAIEAAIRGGESSTISPFLYTRIDGTPREFDLVALAMGANWDGSWSPYYTGTIGFALIPYKNAPGFGQNGRPKYDYTFARAYDVWFNYDSDQPNSQVVWTLSSATDGPTLDPHEVSGGGLA